MRVSYTGNWYDPDGRLATTVNYGTNGGTSMSSRPDSAPSRSTTPGAPEVTDYTYTPEGYVDETTDPRGLVTKKYYDELGNVIETISNYQGDGTPEADQPDVNQTTLDTYNSDNQLVDQTAVNPGGVDQTTENVYGSSGADNDKGLLIAVEYPDPTTGEPSTSNEVTYTYNSAGQTATMTDRDGTTHAYEYDDDGNQIADVITTLGAGVDGTVMERDTSYNDEDQPVDYTTKNADGTILSQVEETYDGNGNVISEAQSHNGAVNDDTPTVSYGYQETAGGQERQTSETYPDGREIDYGYGDSGSLTDAEGLVASIADTNFSGGHVVTSGGSQVLATYTYMSDGTMVGQSRPQTGANESITLDNFGNVADLNWTNSSGTSTDHFGFGYDADGNAMYKENYVLPDDSELYHANGATPGYDGLNRLTTFARGTLSASVSGGTLDTISSPSTTQSWTLDALGNQTAVTTDGTTQSKTQNAQNQTTSVDGSALTYDANGAATTDEQGRKWTYDAWGDPISVTSASGTPIETDGYDGLGRRITTTTYSGGTRVTTDLYYSTSGQVIEQDQGGEPVSQTVYGEQGVNDIIETDQSTSSPGTLDQRTYYQQDANENVTSITNTSGEVVQRFIYSPYGTVTVLNPDGTVKGDGTIASSTYTVTNLFQGMLYNPVTGYYVTPARMYDPMLGTWTSQDPDGDVNGPDLYRLEESNPVVGVDPNGTEDEDDEDDEPEDLKEAQDGLADPAPLSAGERQWYEDDWAEYLTAKWQRGDDLTDEELEQLHRVFLQEAHDARMEAMAGPTSPTAGRAIFSDPALAFLNPRVQRALAAEKDLKEIEDEEAARAEASNAAKSAATRGGGTGAAPASFGAGTVVAHTDTDSAGAQEKWYTVTNADGTEPFSARIAEVSGTKCAEIAWTGSLPQTRNWLRQIQDAEGGPGSIQLIGGKASAGLEEAIKGGRITEGELARRLNNSLGGTWTVSFNTSNGITNIFATRN